jgi:hypothetical protein
MKSCLRKKRKEKKRKRKRKTMKDYDDKDLVIVVVLLLCIAAMGIPNVSTGALVLVEKAFLGLFGMAIGRAMPKTGSNR